MIVTSRPSLGTQTHLSYVCELSKLVARGAAAKGIGVPMFEECLGVGVHEACKPPNGVGGAVRAVVVVPAGYLALVFIAAYMRVGADDGLVGVTVAEAATSI